MAHLKSQDIFKIILFPLIVLLIHVAITYGSRWYYTVNGTDTVMHFLGGISIALAVNTYIATGQKHRTIGNSNIFNRFLFIVSIVTLAATCWKMLEFFADQTIYHYPHFQPSNFDTMKDLLMGLSGGVITALLLKVSKRN